MKRQDLLDYMPFNVVSWLMSDAYAELPVELHGPYLNLCFRAFREQPECRLLNDDSVLWRKAGCASQEAWLEIRGRVLKRFTVSADDRWLTHSKVLESYQVAYARYESISRAGKIGGKASAKARRKGQENEEVRTTVEAPSNDRPTTVKHSNVLYSNVLTDNAPPSPPAQRGGTEADSLDVPDGLAEDEQQPDNGHGTAPIRRRLEQLVAEGARLGHRFDPGARASLRERLRSGETVESITAGWTKAIDTLAELDALEESPDPADHDDGVG